MRPPRQPPPSTTTVNRHVNHLPAFASATRTYDLSAADGMATRTFAHAGAGAVYSAAFSPDGAWLVSASTTYSAVIHTREGAIISLNGRKPDSEKSDVCSVAVAGGGARVATCGKDRVVYVYAVPPDLVEGKPSYGGAAVRYGSVRGQAPARQACAGLGRACGGCGSGGLARVPRGAGRPAMRWGQGRCRA